IHLFILQHLDPNGNGQPESTEIRQQQPQVTTPSAIKVSEDSITPIMGTRFLMVSAYMDHEANGVIRIITVMSRLDPGPFVCIIARGQQTMVTRAELDVHSDNFGFPLMTTDAMCSAGQMFNATHVTLARPSDSGRAQGHFFLQIQNTEQVKQDFEFAFSLCISTMFGRYNNVLQFVQTIEMHRLLGVDKFVVYNTSCGPELSKVLQHYVTEGILEVIPWPIDHFLNPSSGWNYESHKGDLHYYGQQATLNDCIYRNRYRSKYVLLSDADEIIMPYKHASLQALVDSLQRRNPHVSCFIFENRVFPTTVANDSEKFDLPQWRGIPGPNILRHIYSEPRIQGAHNPTKMIVNPRMIIQSSIHSVLKYHGRTFWVPSDLALVIHTRQPLQPDLTSGQLIMDTKLWEYENQLLPNIDDILKRSGIIR
uniref:Glycosyltransferase family 92 protein n=1 Tax=Denticeps clupeoides TaxID=299321 RepID=A0AAY4BA34_9TELE